MNRIKTNMVALGPLEYCASGIRVKRQGGGGYMCVALLFSGTNTTDL